MLVQTLEANISRSMRHLNGVYTQRYNRRHKCDGQLFRGRYKSILIDTDSYLLQAVRYIHRNPLQAELLQNIDAYHWSSHKGYTSMARKWPVCFGSQAFVDRIKEKYGTGKLDKEIPSSRELLPNVTLIIETVCRFFDVSDSEIFKSRRGKTNEARNAAIYLTRKLRRDTLKDIGARFEIHNERTVRIVVERMRIQLKKDRDIVRQLDKLTELINKSQKST